MNAEDVCHILLVEYTDTGLVIIYRVLTQFEQVGLLSRNNLESGKATYELNKGKRHDHLVCLDCGRVGEFFDAEIEQHQQGITRTRGFTLQERTLPLYDNCTGEACPYRPKR